MKKVLIITILFVLFFSLSINNVSAQDESQLKLALSKDWGYNGFGNDIQGVFSLKIKNAPENLVKVEFFIDSTSMAEDIQSPFSHQFNTDSYPLGLHTLSATGYTSDGMKLDSNDIRVEFVTPSAVGNLALKFFLPLIGAIILIALLSVFLPLILSKGKLANLPAGTPRKYGFGGGTVCPKCNRPFPLRLWWMHLGYKKFDRCPYCGKWSFITPNSISELRAAEAAELSNIKPEPSVLGETEAEKFRNDLDDSRYQDI